MTIKRINNFPSGSGTLSGDDLFLVMDDPLSSGAITTSLSLDVLKQNVYNSPNFTGTPLAPTAVSGTNTNQIATTSFVRTEVANLVDSAPALLDTLNELAAAINDDASFATTITNTISSVSGSIPLVTNSGDNRILTSDGTNRGVNAESNLTFNGSLLSVSGNFVVNSGNLDVLGFNINIEPDLLQGQMGWNDTEGTINIALTNDTDIHIGEHSFYRIRNETGSPLYKGQAVYASGVHSNGIIAPSLYTADGSIREIRFIGLMLENLNNNKNGYSIQFGHIENIDTRGNVSSNIAVGDETWADGDILYVHPTVAGKLTKVEPKHSIAAAIILDAANNGRIFVRPTSYGHLEDNHDVAVSGATNGQFLQYNSATDYWVASSSGNFSTLLVNGTGVSVSGHTHTVSNITDFNSSVSGLLPVKNISSGSGILVSSLSGVYTIDSKITITALSSVSGIISTNVSSGDIFDITLSENVTLSNPTNPVNGKTLRWRITQDGTGSRTVALGNKFNIPSSATSPLPFSTSANKMDVLAATYHAGRDKWDVIAFVPGY